MPSLTWYMHIYLYITATKWIYKHTISHISPRCPFRERCCIPCLIHLYHYIITCQALAFQPGVNHRKRIRHKDEKKIGIHWNFHRDPKWIYWNHPRFTAEPGIPTIAKTCWPQLHFHYKLHRSPQGCSILPTILTEIHIHRTLKHTHIHKTQFPESHSSVYVIFHIGLPKVPKYAM